jgi:flagellar biosynthesis/type III secretory pathway M-ring protein FliF/YscJ
MFQNPNLKRDITIYTASYLVGFAVSFVIVRKILARRAV